MSSPLTRIIRSAGTLRFLLLVSVSILLLAAGAAQAAPLLVQDFTNGPAWPFYPYKYGAGASSMANPTLSAGAYGTYDTPDSSTPSNGLKLHVDSTGAGAGPWEVGATSGLVDVSANVAGVTDFNPTKISVSFDCWASHSRPIMVALESYSSRNPDVKTGRSWAYVYPAAAKFYQRKVLDLDGFTAEGTKPFLPNSPYYRVLFILKSDSERGWPKASSLDLQVDNVNISTASLYVNGDSGNDYGRDGKTESNALKTINAAIKVAQPGDIILVRKSAAPYRNYYYYDPVGSTNLRYDASDAAVSIGERGGTPAKWIVLKNYPGDSPVINSSGQQGIEIGHTGASTVNICYVEVRGFEIVGVAPQVDAKDPGEDSAVDSNHEYVNKNTIKGTGMGSAETTAINIEGAADRTYPHHIRIADNKLHDLSGGGVIASSADYLLFENNTIYHTCWFTKWAKSGISVLGARDFSGAADDYRILLSGNTLYDNECRKEWVRSPTSWSFSDGNGIIIDKNRNAAYSHKTTDPAAYRGRTLIQNNVSYFNGGSGIHCYVSDHVDIIHNTAYSNSQRSAFQGSYGEIFAQYSNDIRIYNNILVPNAGENLNSCSYSTTDVYPYSPRWDAGVTGAGVLFRHNVYKISDSSVGGHVTRFYPTVDNTPRTPGSSTESNRLNENADAALSEYNYRTYGTVWTDATNGKFTLVPTSSARQWGTLTVRSSDSTELSFVPSLDIGGSPRVQATASDSAKLPDAGAYESPSNQ